MYHIFCVAYVEPARPIFIFGSLRQVFDVEEIGQTWLVTGGLRRENLLGNIGQTEILVGLGIHSRGARTAQYKVEDHSHELDW